jgi:membrane protease YdiL (CAAX protease family)
VEPAEKPGVTLLVGPFVLAAFVVGQLVAEVVVQFVAAAARAPHAAEAGVAGALRLSFMSLCGGASALTAVWAITRPPGAREQVLGPLPPLRVSWALLALVAAPCASVLAADLEALARTVLPQPAAERALYIRTYFPADPPTRVLTMVATILVAPAVEELVFRGALRRALARRYGTLAAAAATALLFAVAHLSLRGGPIFFALGFANAILAERSGGLLLPFLTHALYNATFYVLPPEWLLEPSAYSGAGPRGPWLLAVAALLGLSASAFAFAAILPRPARRT